MMLWPSLGIWNQSAVQDQDYKAKAAELRSIAVRTGDHEIARICVQLAKAYLILAEWNRRQATQDLRPNSAIRISPQRQSNVTIRSRSHEP